MAPQTLTVDATALQPHTARAAHRGLALFVFLRFLSADEKENRAKIVTAKLGALEEDKPGNAGELVKLILAARREGVPGKSDDRAGKLLQILGDIAGGRTTTFREVKPAFATFDWRATLGFSWTGLKTLSVHPDTLATFPEAFRQGMAARAHQLGDTGASAPENWHGALGDKRVHALLALSSPHLIARDVVERARLRALAREFNSGLAQNGMPSALRGNVNAIVVDAIGAEILHVEMGEDPFATKNGQVQDFDWRVEHFGFRDGISQPFVLTDVQGGGRPLAPPPGGGRPLGDGTWAPVAPGELFLGFLDEDGLQAVEPANATLRNGGTYLVFRKLEQDVAGFHAFLEERRPDPDERVRLAAQMMGRWPNGTPVVRSPDVQVATRKDDAATINDFRFEAEDPHGQKCPVGAHVRRTNPRDYLAGEAARRHRMLRRGISYGGSLLPPGSPGDGEARGLFFVALNARIDLQFEFVQRDWIGSGEVFGRAGAGLCPITGAAAGKHTDAFQEGGRVGAETHLPRFVTTRGGEYFFVPSLAALSAIAAPVEKGKYKLDPDSTVAAYRPAEGSARNAPELFARDRLLGYAGKIIGSSKNPGAALPCVRVAVPGQKRAVVFLGRHADVAHAQTNSHIFTEKHYLDIGRQLTGDNVIIGLPESDADRQIRVKALWDAYSAISPQLHKDMAAFAAAAAQDVIARARPAGRMDLLQQLGFFVPFLFVRRFFGVTAPNWLSPVAIASAYGRSHPAETPREWLARAPEIPESAKPYLTMQTWTRFAFAEVFTNIQRRGELAAMAKLAATELQQHIDQLILRERARPSSAANLLAKLVEQWPQTPGTDEERLRRTRLILTDLLGALMVNVGSPFCKVMEIVLDHSVDLADLLKAHGANSDPLVEHFIEEVLRLNPAGAVQFRTAKADPSNPTWNQLPSGATVADGDLVVLMVLAANQDWRVFGTEPPPDEFSMKRGRNNYLTFGGPKNPAGPHPGGPKDASPDRTALHHCWGERIGFLLVREMIKACAGLTHLRRAAGPKGETYPVLGLPYSLHVRFTPQ